MTWVVFDLNGTLLDPVAVGADALDEAILAGMTLNHVGEYRPFPELLRAAVARRAPDRVEAAMDAAAAMPPFPEAAAALDLLAAAGLRLAVLTNSPTATAERGLLAAGLRERFAHVIGTDQVGVFKPAARVYAHGLATIGAAPADAVMVAAHWWDLRGARAAGMRVAWVGRGEGARTGLLPDPDAEGPDLLAVARALTGAGRRGPGEWFTGEVWMREVVAPAPPSRLHVVDVRFAPGARTAWHAHPLGQTLHVTEGTGRAQRRGGPVEVLRAGASIHFPAGEEHWHGAAPDGAMAHLAIHEDDADGVATHWGAHVTDEEYRPAP